ncbi:MULTISPECIES: prepilin peptidase [Streptomyces]|uniref:A24 family peptidase n=1 Tax=Streptomyces solicathayae TaxID=3081768 RepID=A0ABZ0LS68_9ACTN|nr:A24 family peptidase [Streptomyces sp. HUAS YS2]WOX22330.1 A24 family peptidase [Streptomyces sp. HUAS YS2]
MYVTLIAVAALWGAATGLLVPRAAYRLSVEPEEGWRNDCPEGHALMGPARGWLGGTRCRVCAVTVPAPRRATVEVGANKNPAAAALGETDTDTAPDDTPATPTRRFPLRTTPAIPLVTAAACAALAAATGFRPELAVWLLCAPFAVLLATVDARVHRLPDHLTLPLALAAPLLLGAAALAPEAAGSFAHALLGGLVLGAAYFLLFIINPNGMGFGDVKLALSLGVLLGWYGWGILFAGAFAGFLFGGVYGLGLVLLRKANRKSAIPFGPFMIGGALLGVLFGALAAS